MGSIGNLKAVKPEPISFNTSVFEEFNELHSDNPEVHTHNNEIGDLNLEPSNFARLHNFSNKILKPIQKYSSISFSVFAVIHGVTVTIGPVVSIDLGNELISMGRTLYQSPGLEEILVWGSLATHITASILIRSIKTLGNRIKYGRKRGHYRRQGKRRKNSMVDQRAVIEQNSEGEHEIKDDYEIGLVGGATSFLGLGIRRNLTYRMFGVSTLQMSGWLSLPLVLIHFLQVRVAPLLVEGDSSYVGFEFITYLLQKSSSGRFAVVLNWILYPSLIFITTYHMIYGMLKWNNVRSLRVRKFAVLLINIIGLTGVAGLLRLSWSSEGAAAFITRKFDNYLDTFFRFKFL